MRSLIKNTLNFVADAKCIDAVEASVRNDELGLRADGPFSRLFHAGPALAVAYAGGLSASPCAPLTAQPGCPRQGTPGTWRPTHRAFGSSSPGA